MVLHHYFKISLDRHLVLALLHDTIDVPDNATSSHARQLINPLSDYTKFGGYSFEASILCWST